MKKLTDEEWEKLNEFETSSLLRAVDQFDIARPYISDRLNWQPPQFRDDLLSLHEMAMNVVHHGSTNELSDMFEKAEELNDQIYEGFCRTTPIFDDSEKFRSKCIFSTYYEHALGVSKSRIIETSKFLCLIQCLKIHFANCLKVFETR